MNGSLIQRGNTDIETSMLGGAVVTAPADLRPERDDLLDPELRALSHAYGARLRATPRPAAPEPLS